MLRETDPQTTIWEPLPEQAKRLPAELARVDAYLDDERFLAPWRPLFDRRLGRPSVPIDASIGSGGPSASKLGQNVLPKRPNRSALKAP